MSVFFRIVPAEAKDRVDRGMGCTGLFGLCVLHVPAITRLLMKISSNDFAGLLLDATRLDVLLRAQCAFAAPSPWPPF